MIKAKAVRLLVSLFRRKLGSIITAGLGDSPNDALFLALMDYVYLVQKPDRCWFSLNLPHLEKVNGVGSLGWQQVITKLFLESNPSGSEQQ